MRVQPSWRARRSKREETSRGSFIYFLRPLTRYYHGSRFEETTIYSLENRF
jgi:hypothetical protein